MPLSFVAIDFETANSSRASACALGMTKVINGEVVASKYEVFLPPADYDHFEPRNIAIHKITPTQVANKPRFGEFWDSFREFIEELPILAHNASFDLSVLRAALNASDIEWPELNYACTMVMSRKIFKLTSHSLPFVAHQAMVPWDTDLHHDALYDSRICAEIAISMSRNKSTDDLNQLLSKLDLRMGHLFSEGWYTCRSNAVMSGSHNSAGEKRWKASEVEVNQEADSSHPLFGKIIVFTGKLYSMPRPEAWKLVASVGAIPKEGMTKNTHVLVVGEQDPTKLSPGETQSAKFREAEKLRNLGSDIEVMSETDFLAFLEPESGRA
jgi:DNA polymerase-3 subunit epsilon